MLVLGSFYGFKYGIVNSCLGEKVVTRDNSQYCHGSHLYKITNDPPNTIYYTNSGDGYSEEQRSAVERVINSSNKCKLVLSIYILMQNKSILREALSYYRDQIEFINNHVKNIGKYSLVVALQKVISLLTFSLHTFY